MKLRGAARLVSLGVLAGFVSAAGARGSAPAGPGRAQPGVATRSSPPAIATVGSTSITRAEFEQNFEQAVRNYSQRSASELPEEFRPVFRRQLLEVMIRQKLIELEARRRGLVATFEEAESQLRQDPLFRSRAGGFDEAKYLAIKHSQPVQYDQAIDRLRHGLAAQRLAEALEREHRPDETALRTRIARKLTTASLEYLGLRRTDFAGDYPEPSEDELVRTYRSNLEDFRRPAEAELSVVFVNQPPLVEAHASHADARRAWEARMKQRADSALTALRGGASLDSIAVSLGGIRRNVVIHRNDFPSYWKGGPRAAEAVFAAASGTLLPDPIAGVSGFLIVRVDRTEPGGVAPLAAVSRAIRLRLRSESLARRDEGELRALHETLRDSLRGAGYRIRYAVADTGTSRPAEPNATELDRFYRGHLADYSRFDAVSGHVVVRPLAEVRDDVRSRWISERRAAGARRAAERLFEAWSRGKRDAALERAMTFVREVGPVPAGSAVDTGLAGATLTDTLAGHLELGRGVAPFPRGLIVYHVFAVVTDYVPSAEQARGLLAARMAARREQQEETGARRLYEGNPAAFRTGDVIHVGRLMVSPDHPLRVPLTRVEVEAYYKSHLDKYSAPELTRVRHILVSPKDASPEADLEARRKAEDLLRRIRAGESFPSLAREYSDDPATREDGGDVGIFGHGMMLDAFERAAFAMRVGDLSGPVKTEVGYHILECLERAPQEVTPLKYCYSDAAASAALEKSEEIARQRADSLYRVLKSPAQAIEAAERRGWDVAYIEQPVDRGIDGKSEDVSSAKRETVKPGHFYPGILQYEGQGWAIRWVERISPAAIPTWEQARAQALNRYRGEASVRAMLAKRAELDSLQGAGWSLDSLAVLWGGLEAVEQSPGEGLSTLGGSELLDSLVFGGPNAPLEPGATSDWIELPGGIARLRLLARHEPDPVELARRLENERRRIFERNLEAAYERLKRNHPVRILDPELRAVLLPEIPDS